MSTQVIKPKVKTDEFTSVLGVLVVLGSITMLFVALFVSYSILRIQFGMWSKPGTGSLPFTLGVINTVILMSSSWTYYKGQQYAVAGSRRQVRQWLGLTLGLGIVFLLTQLNLWRILIDSGMTAQSNIVGSVFYMLTGMHGLHIIAAIIALTWAIIRSIGVAGTVEIRPIKLVGLLWHFLDFLWICLFISIFII
ncbi:MAG TPA: heme-copper oxidase subunit III [Candidatus Marinimicrobia bacterium]|jgi:cytochrome c oxidase subunit 3|nr:heme-copper oxidase subunit III [Candidatus Neomarinimicrobiota bacterium]HJM11789.1 heme-copper oxidase subunit III [Candidatus Neomarinimicrobiota bacterium]|tara:strand:- start:1915 stop:2496 length:582 start_codon:yes stop_codon:yes gene_type:complete